MSITLDNGPKDDELEPELPENEMLALLKQTMKEAGHTTFIDFDGVEKPL